MEGRVRKANQFLSAAETIRDLADDEEEVGDAFVTMCVHAGIAAADAICCRSLGRHASGQDHAEAIGELAKVTPDGNELSKDLSAILLMKTRAGYSAQPVNADQRKRAWRRAEKLVGAMKERA